MFFGLPQECEYCANASAVETANGSRRITAYIKRGKVPMWSFDEAIDPTYNDPLSILTKEPGAKLNQELFHQVVSTEKVNT